MAADLQLLFRVGGSKTGDPGFVAARAVELLRERAEAKGIERLMEAIVADEKAIVAAITADADKFAGQAARVFTRLKSPSSGSVTISLDDISRNAGVLSSDSMSKRLQGKTTTEWLALTKQTVANKRRRKAGEPTTFFVETGALKALLTEYLGPAMAALVDPRIVVRKGPRRVSVTLSLMAQASGREKAGVTGASFPGAAGGGIAREESLFVRYLKKVGAPDRDPKHPLAYKLENPRGAHRPFLQNTLVYWISRRLPLVLDKSLRSAVAKSKKKGKTRV